MTLFCGLAINSQPQSSVAMELRLLSIPVLAQASSPTPTQTPITINTLNREAGQLDEEISNLNKQLKDVIDQKIDRSEIKLDLPKTKLSQFQSDWQKWKQNLNPEGQQEALPRKISNIDSYLMTLEGALSPLILEIIPTQEALQASPDNPLSFNQDLQHYQQDLFGDNGSPSDTDGKFGSATQTQIESVLVRHIKEIRIQLSQIESDLLKADLVIKNREIQGLQAQLNGQNIPDTASNSPELPNGNNLVFVVPLIILGLFSGILFLAYSKGNSFKEMKQILSRQGKRDRTRQTGNSYISQENSENSYQTKLYETDFSDEFDDYDQETTPSSNLSIIPSIREQPQPQPQPQQQKQNAVNFSLSSINSEEKLLLAYNNHPKLFEQELRNPKTVTIVTVDKDSIQKKRLGRDAHLKLSSANNGNYFIFENFVFENCYYCLLPKPNLIVDLHKYDTVQELFECQNYFQKRSNRFILIQVAIVRRTNQGIWLYEPGIIQFE
jgi:hypothetical protein